MRDPDDPSHYLDIEVLDLGDEGFATLTSDGVVRYYPDHARAETAARGYRAGFGRRPEDGGPLEWPQRSRPFRDEPWDDKD